ncbi:MAG: tetraacyldisaccharide 4'-kinase [Burkholderiales bacterium]|nr:tetraacyldisaccharide 4'-kinase [Burkholderiales bacterium]
MDLKSDFPARHWYRLSALSVVLAPLALVFGLIVRVRRFAYRAGWLRSERLRVPVVVVGNLTVGGAGKTPLVLWLERELRRRGFRPGIVSRGYGGASESPAAVPKGGDPARYGDEPVLLAERAGAPVWIGADRAAAARALLAAHPDCDVIVLDDGLQHYRLARDVEIAVEDERGHGNGLLLPAGPLREPASRRVDATVVNGAPARPGTFAMQLVPAGLYALDGAGRRIDPRELAGKRVHAVAGIGNPARFFATLAQMGIAAEPHAFPDHHEFTAADLAFADADLVVMTEKDAVKCARLGVGSLAALRVDAEVEAKLAELVAKPL